MDYSCLATNPTLGSKPPTLLLLIYKLLANLLVSPLSPTRIIPRCKIMGLLC